MNSTEKEWLPPPPIVYFVIDREHSPNDHWLHVTGVILCGEERIEMHPVFITGNELEEQMEAHWFIANEAYRRTRDRMEGGD